MLFTKTHHTKMNIYWHATFFYFNDAKPSLEFKVTKYTSLIDLKSIPENPLQYSNNWRIVKLEYRSLSIDNECKIQFNKFKLKTNENLKML